MNRIQNFSNAQPQKTIVSAQKNYGAKPSFKSKAEWETKITQDSIQSLFGTMGYFVKKIQGLCKRLNDNDGELQTQVINALFTTTLAPFFIAFNPISKQDEKTKQYTALRQPVSAGIAVSGGVAMTVAINKFMDKICYDGHIKTIDGRINPSAGYLENDFNKILKSKGSKEEQIKYLNSLNPDIAEADKLNSKSLLNKIFFNKEGEISKQFKKAGLEAYAKEVQKDRQLAFSSMIGADPEKLKIIRDGVLGIVEEGKDGKEVVKEFGYIPNFTKNEIEKYITENNVYNQTLGDLMKKHFNFEFHVPEQKDEMPTIKDISAESLSKIKAPDFLDKLGITGEKTQIKDMANVSGTDLGKLILGTNDDICKMNLQEFFEKLGLIRPYNPELTIQENLNNKARDLDKIMNVKLMDNANDKTTPILKLFKDRIAQAKNNYNYKGTASSIDFAANNIAKITKKIGTKIKTTKNFTGIIFNLFTTAVTCTALNWAYPRFVETFFPSLVKKDNKPAVKEGGNK